MDNGKLEHIEVDYGPMVDEALPKADNLAKVLFPFDELVVRTIIFRQIFRLLSSLWYCWKSKAVWEVTCALIHAFFVTWLS